MLQVKRNAYWDALLNGRRFEVRVPYNIESCIARLEKHIAAGNLGFIFSKVTDGLYDFELCRGSIGVETVGRGKLEDIGDGHTLFTGHIGTNTRITNAIITVFGLVGFVLFFSANKIAVMNLAFGITWLVIIVYLIVSRRRALNSWLHWLLKGLEPPQARGVVYIVE